FQVSFEQIGPLSNGNAGLPGDGNLDIEAFDVNGDAIGSSTTTTDDERLTVPVVEDEIYYLRVAAASGTDAINVYSFTAVNDPAPVPFQVDLQSSSDSGRHDSDNITNNTAAVLDIYLDDDRLEEYANLDLVADTDFFVDIFNNGVLLGVATFQGPSTGTDNNSRWEFATTNGDLQEGHNNFLTSAVRIRDAATPQVDGRGGFSTPLQVTLDTIAPPISIIGLAGDGSDTGVEGVTATVGDRITSDTSASVTGTSEADAIIRLYADSTSDDSIATPGEFALAMASPLDGDHVFTEASWTTSYVRDLNDPTSASSFALDGLREIVVTAEDIAGNVGTPAAFDIFVDTQGPQVTAVEINNAGNAYDLFDPKPSTDGPTPPVNSLVISLQDLANRTDAAPGFLYNALQDETASDAGAYTLVGDNVGTIAIASVSTNYDTATNGSPATSNITLTFNTPLPDDRYSLAIADLLVDPAGNSLNGESNASQPVGNPSLPTGDSQPGGDFQARFTVDSRPEIATVGQSGILVDANGNWNSDPTTGDSVNRDLNFVFGIQTDAIFTGQFNASTATSTDGFDRLGAYGRVNDEFRWELDFDNDGVLDYSAVSGIQVDGLPVAGDFNPSHPGDEIGIFDGNTWFLDTEGDNNLGGSGDLVLASNLSGLPIVGDFDGNGTDDLATYSPSLNTFTFDMNLDGVGDETIAFGFPGVLDRPFSGDFNLDGIDDIGLTVPNQSGNSPSDTLEWYLLISEDTATGSPLAALDHSFAPIPLGNDQFGQYGNNLSVPTFGNFDPPASTSPPSAASSSFDPSTGELSITLNSGASVQVDSVEDTVQVLIDGQVAPDLGTVLSRNVTALSVQGSHQADSIDLAGVTVNAFDRLQATTVWAGNGNDSVIGSQFADTVWAGGGSDSVSTGDGNDWINGQSGSDLIHGGSGADRILAGGGHDEIHGNDGNDFVQGNSGNDVLAGGSGNDRLNGSGGNDQLLGNAGDDRLLGGGGRDTVDGGTGNDFLSGQGGADQLDGGPGADRIKGGIGNDLLQGGDGNDRLMGEAGNDVLLGGGGDDILRGQDGADELTGGLGDDLVNGGQGFDRLVETYNGDFLLTDTALTGLGTDQLIGLDGATLTGGDDANTLDARTFTGAATLIGRAGNDRLYGGTGDDVLSGDAGDDILVAGPGNDRLQGGAGNDIALGGAGDDILKGQGGSSDTLDGGSGNDTYFGSASEIDEEFADLNAWIDDFS
ncbi:hypothetical protein OAJ60_00750, partial [Planctomycetaceae bacterium]|nr:hypothetical protein [Planctomycetaceae bacterium]